MGLKESKKWAIGSVHENGGGKFEILDRWFDEKSDSIMLKYKYENGKIEENKEANVNSSEWKWRKVRGLAGTHEEEHHQHPEDYTHWDELIEGLYVRLEKLHIDNKQGVDKLVEYISINQKMMHDLINMVSVQQKQIDQLIKDNNIINKLLEKI